MKWQPCDSEFQPWLTNLLLTGQCEVTFLKTDGTERVMFCTLEEKAIPTEKLPKGSDRQTPDYTRRVFDLDKGEWRSFRWDSILDVRAYNETVGEVL